MDKHYETDCVRVRVNIHNSFNEGNAYAYLYSSSLLNADILVRKRGTVA